MNFGERDISQPIKRGEFGGASVTASQFGFSIHRGVQVLVTDY